MQNVSVVSMCLIATSGQPLSIGLMLDQGRHRGDLNLHEAKPRAL